MPSGFVADQRVHPQWLNHRFNRLQVDGHIGCEDNPRQVARQDQVRFPHEPLQYLLIRAAHNPGTRYENRPLLKNGRLFPAYYIRPCRLRRVHPHRPRSVFPSAITPTTTSGAGIEGKLRSPQCPDNSYQCPILPIPQAGQAVKTPDIKSAYPPATLIPVYQNGKHPSMQRNEKQHVNFQSELTYISFQLRRT